MISEGEINISLPVLSSLRGQNNGSQTSDDDLLDLFGDSENDYRTTDTVEQPPDSPSERTTQELSAAAAIHHDNEKAHVPATTELKTLQEEAQTVAISQRTMDVTEAQQDHKPETKRRSRKRRKAKKSTGSPKKNNSRIDATDVSAPLKGSKSWHSLTSAQKPAVRLPSVVTVSVHPTRGMIKKSKTCKD